MEEEKIIERRSSKLINFFKRNPDVIFWIILTLATFLRLYYFAKTLNQPLWWDEADYMCISKIWAIAGFDYPINAVRPILLPLMAAIFIKLGSTELLIRLSIFILSILSLVGTYYFAKEISNKRVAQIAMLFMSVFYLGLFYTFRILVDIHTLTFYIFTALFFYKYLQNRSNKMLYIGTVIVAIGTLFKLTVATFLFAFLIYLIFTEKWRFLKRKELWMSGLIFLLILSPYIIWGYFKFGGFVITQAGAFNAPESNLFLNGFENLMFYVKLAPGYISWVLLVFFILGLGYLLMRLILGFDIILKNKFPELNKQFYLFLVLIIPIIVMCFSVEVVEDRYIIMVFPAVFIICAEFILKVYNFIKRNQKILAIVFLVAILGFSTYSMLMHSHQIIVMKQNSYGEIKTAGLWMKQNLDKDSIIFSGSLPQIAYYSDIKTKGIPTTEEDFLTLLEQESKYANKSYLMLSLFQPHADWAYKYPVENNLTVIQAYFSDVQKTKPNLIIYKL